MQQRFSKPLIVVEAGNWGWKSSLLPQSKRPQQRRKAALILDSMKMSSIDAIGLGSGDLALGLDFFASHDAPFVLTNVSCQKQNPWNEFRQFSAGGRTIGFLSFVSTTGAVPEGCVISRPHEVVQSVIQNHNVDLWIVSAELSQEESRTVASTLHRALFIDSKSRRLGTTPKKLSDNAALLSSGSRGKHIGLASVYLPSDASGLEIIGLKESISKERKRYQDRIDKARKERKTVTKKRDRKRLERQEEYYSKKIAALPSVDNAENLNPWIVTNALHGLEKSIPSHKETKDLIQAYKEAEEMLEAQTDDVYNGPFVGSKSCIGCHPLQYNHWKGTAHANAWKTLVDEKRSQDQACYSCHVTGAHHEQGPQTLGMIQGLENVGCESCHGPGKEHVQSSGQADMITVPSVQSCTQCHDGVKDEGRFNAALYYPKIRHPSLGNGEEQ